MRQAALGWLFLSVVLGVNNGCRKSESAAPRSAESATLVADVDSRDIETEAVQGSQSRPEVAFSDSDRKELGFISAKEYQEGSWSRRLLIALPAGGPSLLELSVGIGGQSLEEVTEVTLDEMAAALLDDLVESDATLSTDEVSKQSSHQWETLLQHPLVRSGWIGNLVPDEAQVSQLLAMYDSDFDQLVSRDELSAFLSRGVSRRESIQVSDIGEDPAATGGTSPWGKLDADTDFSLDAQERMAATEILRGLDFNGDGILAKSEAQQPRGMSNARSTNMNQVAMFETTTLQVADMAIESAEKEKQLAARRKLSMSLLDHYTFLSAIPRDQWSAWQAERWQLVDTDGDQLLNNEELRGIADVEPDFRLALRFPSIVTEERTHQANNARTMVRVVSVDELKANREDDGAADASQEALTHRSWISHGKGGRIYTPGLIADVEIEDVFSHRGRELLRQRLSAALKDSQLRAFLVNQLELEEDAFALLDSDEDQLLSDKEFERVWRWLTVRQGSRISVRWMTAAMPWFQVLDEDGDGRLVAREISRAEQTLTSFDADRNGVLTPDELPLVVVMSIQRSDQRLEPLISNEPSSDPRKLADDDWFGAMDANRDGLISREEFLGEVDDFEARDPNKDGFLSRQEVY